MIWWRALVSLVLSRQCCKPYKRKKIQVYISSSSCVFSFGPIPSSSCLDIPFGPVLLAGDLINRPPNYVDGQKLNLSCLYPRRGNQTLMYRCHGNSLLFVSRKSINVVQENWPTLDEKEKKQPKKRSANATPDPSQMRALQHMFNHRVALVQVSILSLSNFATLFIFLSFYLRRVHLVQASPLSVWRYLSNCVLSYEITLGSNILGCPNHGGLIEAKQWGSSVSSLLY